MSNSQDIQRVVGIIDERLPFDEFVEASRKQAEAMPLEIIVNGVAHEAFDCRPAIVGHLNIMIASYRPKVEEQSKPAALVGDEGPELIVPVRYFENISPFALLTELMRQAPGVVEKSITDQDAATFSDERQFL
jgi:hypothetical protein